MIKGRKKNNRNKGKEITVFLHLMNLYSDVGYSIPGCFYLLALVIILLKSVLRDIFE